QAIANNTMPDLGYEIEDFQYYTWQIAGWTSLEKRITGPEFEAGGWKWRILLFPHGNNDDSHVSIYLEFSDPIGALADLHCCAQFVLLLWNPENPTFYASQNSHHRFTAEEPDWGFKQFCALNKLFVPSITHTRPLIEYDACNITALVRIIKDPTGVLWHDFTNYDSKKMTGYVNLENQGATSYLNVELQLLYSIKYFRKAIYQISTEDDKPIKSIPLAMQRIFCNLQVSDTPVETTELTKSFEMDSSDRCMAHDVQEFYRMLLDCLDNKMKNTYADGTISKLFTGEMKSYVRCVNVDYESSFIEDYYDIQLEVKGCKTLNDSFLEFIREEFCVGNNKYQTETYGLQDAKKGVIFESFPSVLRIQLKRFEYNMQRDAIVKINDSLEYPMEIDLQGYLSSDSDKSKPHNYLLHGVIVHSGELHEDNYYILLKPEKNGNWFKFDDDRVIPVTDKAVLEDNYGGKVSNAYILVYIRESDIDFVLSPVLVEDIPKHIQERHLYLTTKILTLATFEHHQGFDLANIDDQQYPLSEFPQFKVLKSETYSAFKVAIAHKFGIPVEQMRFWVFVHRQNKTIRPDTPIPDDFLGIAMEGVHARMASGQNELKLFLEVTDKLINGK
ncbi:6372_t:CDS:10, partial [Cetraspora pellucida]